ncbi:MAG: kinase [Bdellovibrionales bacterium]
MVIVQSPVRISFFGGGTDYPVWFREHGGAVLATAIDKYLYIQCRKLTPFHDHKHRIIYSKMEDVREIDEIKHPAVREVFRYMRVEEGIEMHYDSDLPARSGMGSSSSFVVGLMHALHALRGEMVDKEHLAKDAIYVEQELIKENVGCQDQIMCAYGGFNMVLFKPGGGFSVQPVPAKAERLTELHNHLMLFYTGTSRLASDIAKEQIKSTPKKASELTAMREMVDEGLKILTGHGPITDFGRLLHESWKLKRSLTDKISNSQIDDIYETGMKNGAVGGKLLGAGGGGFVLLFVPPEHQQQVRASLSQFIQVHFGYDSLGTNIIFFRQPQVA